MSLQIRNLGKTDYSLIWGKMRQFTDERTSATQDEIWLTFHNPVYTFGTRANLKQLHQATDIPIIHSDRGGQITYHGPGQIIAYVLLDLRRKKFGIRTLVTLIEQAIIDLLQESELLAHRVNKRPGVYVADKKISALGLRVRRGCSYHGVSLNIDCDLQPFANIDPCGYADLEVTSMAELGCSIPISQAITNLGSNLVRLLDSK